MSADYKVDGGAEQGQAGNHVLSGEDRPPATRSLEQVAATVQRLRDRADGNPDLRRTLAVLQDIWTARRRACPRCAPAAERALGWLGDEVRHHLRSIDPAVRIREVWLEFDDAAVADHVWLVPLIDANFFGARLQAWAIYHGRRYAPPSLATLVAGVPGYSTGTSDSGYRH